MRNLIIAAHPDDEILGCGGIIKKYSQTQDFFALILTNGADLRYDKTMEEALKNSAFKANNLIGTKEVFFENLPNQQMETLPVIQITQVIEKYIQLLTPYRIFTHHAGDLNRDHRIVYEAAVTASRPMPGQIVKQVYSYFVPSSTEWNFIEGERVFVPNVFVDITEEIDAKIEAFSCYESEARLYPHPRSKEALKAYAGYWGITAGIEYAEPFKLIRSLCLI